MSPLVRARLIGAVVLLGAFGAGVFVGRYLPQPEVDGVRVMIKASDRIPLELDALGLTDAQRAALRPILQRGTLRIDSVMKSLLPAMDGAIGATDSEVRLMLTPNQRTALDAARRKHPMKTIQERRVIDTIRKR
jgi:hypothetical protein